MDEQSPAFVLHKLVTELDKMADIILQKQFGLSYKRFHFLLALLQQGTVSQHSLAKELGHSDPAVSNMVQVLMEQGYLTTEQSAQHRRKRLVSITVRGRELTLACCNLLNEHFDKLMKQAALDSQNYRIQTLQLLQTIRADKAPRQ